MKRGQAKLGQMLSHITNKFKAEKKLYKYLEIFPVLSACQLAVITLAFGLGPLGPMITRKYLSLNNHL